MVLKEWHQPGFGWYLRYMSLGQSGNFVGHRLSRLQSVYFFWNQQIIAPQSVQSSLLIWSCFILRFTVLTFVDSTWIWGVSDWYPQISTPKWSFLVGKPHGFVGETHHFRKPPIFWTFLGRTHLYRTCPKNPQKPAIFFAGSPRASEKTLWWAAQVETPKQWGIHRFSGCQKKNKGWIWGQWFSKFGGFKLFFVKCFTLTWGDDRIWTIFDPHGSMTLMDLWTWWFFCCHRYTESRHQCTPHEHPGNIGWRRLLFQIDDHKLKCSKRTSTTWYTYSMSLCIGVRIYMGNGPSSSTVKWLPCSIRALPSFHQVWIPS